MGHTAYLLRRIEMVEAWGRGMPLTLKYAPDVVFREIGNLFIHKNYPRKNHSRPACRADLDP